MFAESFIETLIKIAGPIGRRMNELGVGSPTNRYQVASGIKAHRSKRRNEVRGFLASNRLPENSEVGQRVMRSHVGGFTKKFRHETSKGFKARGKQPPEFAKIDRSFHSNPNASAVNDFISNPANGTLGRVGTGLAVGGAMYGLNSMGDAIDKKFYKYHRPRSKTEKLIASLGPAALGAATFGAASNASTGSQPSKIDDALAIGGLATYGGSRIYRLIKDHLHKEKMQKEERSIARQRAMAQSQDQLKKSAGIFEHVGKGADKVFAASYHGLKQLDPVARAAVIGGVGGAAHAALSRPRDPMTGEKEGVLPAAARGAVMGTGQGVIGAYALKGAKKLVERATK